MNFEQLQEISDRWSNDKWAPDHKHICNGMDVALDDIQALLVLVNKMNEFIELTNGQNLLNTLWDLRDENASLKMQMASGSVLVWQDAATPPTHGDLLLLAFRSDSRRVGVALARYRAQHKFWCTPYGEWIEHPLAYADIVLPPAVVVGRREQ